MSCGGEDGGGEDDGGGGGGGDGDGGESGAGEGVAKEEEVASKDGHSRHGRGINTSIPEQNEHESASKSIGCAPGKVGARKSTAHLSSKLVRPHGHVARK